jgi:hypothetical protein
MQVESNLCCEVTRIELSPGLGIAAGFDNCVMQYLQNRWRFRRADPYQVALRRPLRIVGGGTARLSARQLRRRREQSAI